MNLFPMEVVAMDGNAFGALIPSPPPPPLPPLLVNTVTGDVVVTVLSAGACMSQPLRLLLLDD